MTTTISTLISQPFALSTSYTLTVVDQTSSRSVTIGTVSTNTYWRNVLASTASAATPSTTSGTYKSFSEHVRAQINAGTSGGNWWHFDMLQTGPNAGLFQIRYTGTGVATITWDASPGVVENILGFTTNVSVTSGAPQVATYQPMYCLFVCGRDTSGYQIVPQHQAAAIMPGGIVYGWTDTTRHRRLTFDAHAIPYDTATGAANGLNGTALWPTENPTRVWTPSGRIATGECAVGVSILPPWTWSDFFATALGQSCTALWGTFNTWSGGPADTVYATPDALMKMQAQMPMAPNFLRSGKWMGMAFNQTGTESI